MRFPFAVIHFAAGSDHTYFRQQQRQRLPAVERAGKSALLECIAVGITGSPLRKIRSEEIINDAADKCHIRLHLTNDASSEELVISRYIPRKGVSMVACTLYWGGELVTTDEAVQHSVDAYNKYILNKLGVTREELLNNFILSKYRYEDFLSSSDKEKKEIINRFSNGILVDEAIARVEEDIVPLSNEQQKINLELAGIDGRIEMLREQIEKEVKAGEERGRTRETRIAELKESITAKRESIRTNKETLNGIDKTISEVEQADKLLQELESSDTSLEDCLKTIETFMPLFPNAHRTDWNHTLKQKKEDLAVARVSLANLDAAVRHAEDILIEKRTAWEKFKEEYAGFCERFNEKSDEYHLRLQEIDKSLRDLTSRIEDLRRKCRTVSAGIDELSNKLTGSITCPKCGHEFLVAQPQFDIEAGMKELRLRQQQLSEINGRIESVQNTTEEVELQQTKINTDRRTLDSKRSSYEQILQEAIREVNETATADLTVSLCNSLEQEKKRSMDTAKRKFEVDDKVWILEVQRE